MVFVARFVSDNEDDHELVHRYYDDEDDDELVHEYHPDEIVDNLIDLI